MVKVASLFSQLLHEFPRTEFEQLVREHKAERGAKGFQCWTQFVAMLFCQLARTDSLREICNGLSCCLGKLVHLGVANAPNKSTLSYANEHRSASLFEALFWSALSRFRGHTGVGTCKTKFRFRNKLLSLDSTTISLCLALFPWARFRRAKAHVLLDARRLHAGLHPHHRGPTARRQGRAGPVLARRLHRGHGSGIQRLRTLR